MVLSEAENGMLAAGKIRQQTYGIISACILLYFMLLYRTMVFCNVEEAMTKKVKNRIVTVIALLLLAVAVFLVIQLMMGDESLLFGSDKTETSAQEFVTAPLSQYDSGSADVDSKYLWEYGWQKVEKEKPSEVPEETTTKAKENTTYNGLLTYNDEPQTAQKTTLPQADGVYEIVTGANGEVLTDSAGDFVTKPAEPTTEKGTEEPTASDNEENTTADSTRARAGIFDFSVF